MRLRGILETIHALLGVVFPPSAAERAFCEAPQERWAAALNPRALAESPWVITIASYDDELVRSAVHLAKFHASTKAAARVGEALGEYLLETAGETAAFSEEPALVIPIPLGQERLRERGYNQAARIAKAALRTLPPGTFEYAPELLRRRETKPQTELSKKERLQNVREAFSVPEAARAAGRRVILIDDVVTTGATLADARRALREAGARDITALVFARAETR